MSGILTIEQLRERYGEASGGALFDPHFRAVADLIFKDGDIRQAPYWGVAAPDFRDLDVALLGIPMDLGVPNRSGGRFGPRAVRNVDRVGPYEHVLRAIPTA